MANTITPEAAKTIMGRNFIDISEVSTIFPCRTEDLVFYEEIPFSTAMLYWCCEENTPFVLVPGIHYNGRVSKALTIQEMRNHFSKELPNLFAPSSYFDSLKTSFVNNTTCYPRWYLLPKKAIDKETIEKLLRKLDIGQYRRAEDPSPWEEEPAVVYIYAWLLFLILRQEEIFPDIPFLCADIHHIIHRPRVRLQFYKKQIVIHDRPIRTFGIVPSIKPNLE